MKNLIVAMALGLFPATAVFAQSYFEDDIYYNPKKDNTTQTVKKTEKKKSNYIADFSNMDVDSYNRRGQYYSSPVDTIGSRAEQDADFVYTQKIQKYYNPTIVVDNADVLADVLENSYGNVDIEISAGGYPVFLPSYAYGWPYYGRRGFYADPWGWSISFYDPWYSWNWGPSWGWGPSWSWSWGPSWTWGPSWSWGWGPSWGWGSAWGPSWGHHHGPVANWNPNGNRPVAPNHGWSQSGRPSYGIANNHRQPVGTSGSHQGMAPTSSGRPSSGVTNNNGRWEYVNGGHRVPAGSTGTVTAPSSTRPTTTNGNGTVNNHRTYGSGNSGTVTNNRNQSTTTNRNSNVTNRNSNSNNNRSSNSNNTRTYNNSNSSRSYGTGNSGSYNRSSGGSFGGSRSSGGAGRSTGGGGHRR